MKISLLLLALISVSACSSMNKSKSWRSLELDAQWIRQIGDLENTSYKKVARFEPIIFKDSVIVGSSNDGIAALYRKNGKRKWFFPVRHGVEASGTVYLGQRVIFGAKDGYIYSLDANTGKMIWKFFAKAEVLSDVLVHDGAIYVLSGANVLYKIDADTGKQNWVYSRVQRTRFSVRGGSKALAYNGSLFIGFSDGFFVSLKLTDGSLNWERKLGTGGRLQDVDTSPVRSASSLFVSSYDGALYSLNAKDGSVRWRLAEGGFSKPLITGAKLLYPTSSKKLLLIDANSGKVEWTKNIKSIASNPSKHENLWIVSMAGGPSLIIDAITKKKIGSYDPGRGSMASPVWDSEFKRFYVNSNAGNLHAINLRWVDSRKLWSWE